MGFLAVRPKRESSLSNYRGWLRQGGLPPPPSEGGGGADAFPSSASPLSVSPPLSPCSFLDNEGEGDTSGRLKSSFCISPSTLGPSEGGRAGWGRGAGDAALDLDADVSGGLVVGPVGAPAWRLEDLLRSA